MSICPKMFPVKLGSKSSNGNKDYNIQVVLPHRPMQAAQYYQLPTLELPYL